MAQAFITRRGGGGGGVNQTLPAQVTAFTATADSTPSVTLSWLNPTEYWAGTLIVKKAGSAPEGVNDGKKIYNGTGTSFVDTAVEYDTEYFYRAFPYNAKKQYQTLYAVASAAPVEGIALSDFPEETLIRMTEGGTGVNFYLAKHDYESELNGAGRQLLVRKDCYDERVWNSSKANGFASSTICSWLNSNYKAKFGETVQSMMGTTTFKYLPGNNNYSLSTLSRSVFLLSFTELGLTNKNHKSDGTALPIASTLQIAYYNGSAVTQWTRSPTTGTNDDGGYSNIGVYAAYKTGMEYSGVVNSATFGSRPCFTLPADALVDPTPNADGSYNLIES